MPITCRNRHGPRCQGAAARAWLAEREAELLPVPYYHLVFTLPAAVADFAYQNKAAVYDILFKASSETLITIAADPKHLGARVGAISADASSAHSHDRARWRRLAGWSAMDRLLTRLLPARARTFAPVPPLFLESSWSPSTPASCNSTAHMLISRHGVRSKPISHRCARANGGGVTLVRP